MQTKVGRMLRGGHNEQRPSDPALAAALPHGNLPRSGYLPRRHPRRREPVPLSYTGTAHPTVGLHACSLRHRPAQLSSTLWWAKRTLF